MERRLGVRVDVEAAGRTQIAEKMAGSSYQTSNDPRLHFGLGKARTCRVTVHWSGGPQELELEADRYYRLVEGEAPAPWAVQE